jgi:anti-anti-sigma factor
MASLVIPMIHPGLRRCKTYTVTLDGDLDIANRSQTRMVLRRLMFRRYCVIDFKQARIGDATCLSDIAAVGRINATTGGTIVLCASNSLIRKILKIVRFDEIFPIVSTLAEAYELIKTFEQHRTCRAASQ